jgi:hypothetical protein
LKKLPQSIEVDAPIIMTRVTGDEIHQSTTHHRDLDLHESLEPLFLLLKLM